MKKVKFLLPLIAIVSLFVVKNTYADIQDVSYTSTYNGTSFPELGNFCNNNDASLPNCSDYTYLKIEQTKPTSNNIISYNGQILPTPASKTTFIILELPSDTTRIGFFGLSSQGFDTTDNIKFTLTNDVGVTCPEPEEPDCPDPEENSQFINVVLDAFWKYHTVFAGAVAGLIAIFVVYRIIKGMLR